MGDRVLYQVVSKDKVSPVVYAHWGGHEAPEVVGRLFKRMKDRLHDVDYTAARLVQEAIGSDEYDTGFGIWATDNRLTEADSHGDAGVVLIDADTGKCECFGGYLKAGENGMPVERGDDEEY